MNTKETSIEETKSVSEDKYTLEKTGAILPGDLNNLSETFDGVKNRPESSLVDSAEQLNRLAHSFFEQGEMAYLEEDQTLPMVDSSKIWDICKPAETSNSLMKTALEYKKERVKALKTLAEIRKSLEK